MDIFTIIVTSDVCKLKIYCVSQSKNKTKDKKTIYLGMKRAKVTGCSGKVSMHCRGSEDCMVLVATVCPHGSLA